MRKKTNFSIFIPEKDTAKSFPFSQYLPKHPHYSHNGKKFLESDTVDHCGTTTAGQFVLTVNYDDIATGWTEQRAIWGKGETGVLQQTKDVENSLPF